jgi:uncharacterized protein YndB with AHSA1/START domain
MKQGAQLEIASRPEAIWPYCSEPLLLTSWFSGWHNLNRKVEGPVKRGETFGITVLDFDQEQPRKVEVIEYKERIKVTYRIYNMSSEPPRFDDIIFQLAPVKNSTKVEIANEMDGLRLSLFTRLLWLIFRNFRAAREGGWKEALTKLKNKIENSTNPK